jgi:uncharacterized protein (TIGR02246 family)
MGTARPSLPNALGLLAERLEVMMNIQEEFHMGNSGLSKLGKRIMKSVTLAMLALVFLSSAVLAGSDADAIAEAGLSWEKAYNSGDGAAVAALYTADGALLPPGGARVEGQQAIADFWAGAIASGLANVELETTELEFFGDTATEVGFLTGTVPAEGGGTTAIAGKFIVIWKRGADGVWRLHRDIWNMGR